MYLLDDATQEAYIAFWRAKERYDGREGVNLFAFACTRVKGAVKDYIRSNHYRAEAVHKPSATAIQSLDVTISVKDDQSVKLKDILETAPEVDKWVEDTEKESRIRGHIEVLPPRHKEVIERRFWGEQTLKAIGLAMGFTEGRASQLEKSALKRMREAA